MSLPSSFLVSARQYLQRSIKNASPITLVIGNESADLDSFSSSFLYAFLKSKKEQDPLVPLLNIPSQDIKLRPEFLSVFKIAGVESSHVLTLDDLPGPAQLKAQNTSWILVDHNKLQGPLGESYEDRVIGVVDHHDDEKAVPEDASPRIIEPCGSCTSLVTRLEQSSLSDSAKDPHGLALAAQVALASILIDTTCLQDKSKTRQVDIDSVNCLEQYMIGQTDDYDRQRLFDRISSAKQDVDGMSVYDILRKDYKQWDESEMKLGISSAVKPLSFLVAKAEREERSSSAKDTPTSKSIDLFIAQASRFANERNLGVYAIMTGFTSDKDNNDGNRRFQRELMTWARDEAAAKAISVFERDAVEELQLEPMQQEAGSPVKIWRQRNVSKSRKQVAPMLRRAISGK